MKLNTLLDDITNITHTNTIHLSGQCQEYSRQLIDRLNSAYSYIEPITSAKNGDIDLNASMDSVLSSSQASKALPIIEAWSILRNPSKSKKENFDAITNLLENAGVSEPEDLLDSSEELIKELSSYLKETPSNKFARLIQSAIDSKEKN